MIKDCSQSNNHKSIIHNQINAVTDASKRFRCCDVLYFL